MTADIAVIGAGLIGAAAARHLAERGHSVVLVGPVEPVSPGAGESLVASHYDEARITRALDMSPVWSELARRSMAAYPIIEQASGIRFHRPDGFMRVETRNHHRLALAAEVAAPEATTTGILDGAALSAYGYTFPRECRGILESGAAGIINPRRLLAAQLQLFESAGGRRCRNAAVKLKVKPEMQAVRIVLDDGGEVRAARALVCTGALTNYFDLFRTPLPLEIAVETVWLQEADPDVLREMPCLWYEMEPGAISHVYVLPPVKYPDGRYYVKIGGERDPDISLASLADIREFFRHEGTPAVAEQLRSILYRLVPEGLLPRAYRKPCILAYTPSGYPIIDQVEERVWAAIGGNGASAKSSDAIGSLAAGFVDSGSWSDSLAHDSFRLP